MESPEYRAEIIGIVVNGESFVVDFRLVIVPQSGIRQGVMISNSLQIALNHAQRVQFPRW